MLKREPSERANLEEILCHDWFQMEMETIPLPALPLISREHLSEEDHNYLVDKMVEGEIGTKEEVLKYVDTINTYVLYMYVLLLTHLNLLRKKCAKLNQTWLCWSLLGALSKFCQTAPSSVQNGSYY